MKTCKEMAEMWKVTERTVTTFCKSGKIPGAIKNGKSWQIPDNAEKPVDGRVSSGKYIKKSMPKEKKSLPIEMCIRDSRRTALPFSEKIMILHQRWWMM